MPRMLHASSLIKNKSGKHDPEMRQAKSGNHYYFGIKAYTGVDVESGGRSVMVLSVRGADISKSKNY